MGRGERMAGQQYKQCFTVEQHNSNEGGGDHPAQVIALRVVSSLSLH